MNFKSDILFCSFVVFSLQNLREVCTFLSDENGFFGRIFWSWCVLVGAFYNNTKALGLSTKSGEFKVPLFRLVIEFFLIVQNLNICRLV